MAGWLEHEEITVEIDIVAYFSNLTILFVADGRVNPGIRYVWLNFALKECPDIFIEGHVFGIAQFWIRLRIAVFITADFSGLVALGKGSENSFTKRWSELEASSHSGFI